MKQLVLFYLMLLGAFITCPSVHGQGSSSNTEDPPMNYIPSSQTWAFMRYGSTPVDYYTGTAKVNVPIYEYKDNDFTLNISAGYASNGFQPQRQTGILGLNWFLNCGGVITREIRGVPDDEGGTAHYHGCMLSNKTYHDKDIFNLKNVDPWNESNVWTVNGREVDADIFHFNFMGHSGSFHMNGQRKICVYNTGGNHGTYEIKEPVTTAKGFMEITIYTGDGYTYVFGGDEKTVEQSIQGNFTHPGHYVYEETGFHPIVTWFLREVTAPNGRKITFEYAPIENTEKAYGFLPVKDNNKPHYIVNFAMGNNRVSNINHCRQASVIRTNYLTEITIGDGQITDGKVHIDLLYSVKKFREATSFSPTGSDYAKVDANIVQYLKQLDSIVVTSGLGTVRQCKFNYRNKNSRLILDKIDVLGIGTYKMSYYENSNYPEISTSAVDFWGYYNGRDDNRYDQIAPTSVDTISFDEYIKYDYRNPNGQYSIIGCLKRIQYPTKGFTEFEYEPNRAKYIIQKNRMPIMIMCADSLESPGIGYPEEKQYLSALNLYWATFHYSDETGGVRIRKIIDYDGKENAQIREFKYGTGIVMSFTRFWAYSKGVYNVINPNLNITNNTLDRSHIEYDVVTERYSDGSYVEYRFNNYQSHPDEYDDQQREEIEKSNLPPLVNPAFLNNILRKPNSCHHQRGKLNRLTSYDKNGKKVRCEYMTYDDQYTNSDQNYSTYIVSSGIYMYSVKKYTSDYRLTSKKVTEYFGQDSISTTTNYKYNDLGQLHKTQVIQPNNRVDGTEVCYLDGTAQNFGTAIVPKNSISEVIKSYMPSPSSTYEQITSMTKYTYKAFNNLVKPDSIYQFNTDGRTTRSITPNVIYPDPIKFTTKVVYRKYDTMGRPVEIEDVAGVVTSFLWGYNGLYPVAKVVGATYATINEKLGRSSDAPLTGALTADQEVALRSIPDTYVDTYGYKAQVGLIRHTDPSGKTYTFEYDSYGRLKRTNDPMGQIQQYDYHLN